jgi:hypothetical protein
MKYAFNVNLKARAATQFLHYEFNSFCSFKGRQLAAGPDGLFTMGGDTDNGAEITAWFETVLSAWGSQTIKRPRFCYLDYISDGGLQLILLDGDLNEQAKLDVGTQSGSLPQIVKIPVPRTVAEKFWKFRVENTAGAGFHINGLDVFFIVRPSGLSQST